MLLSCSARVGELYQYLCRAVDQDGDTLTYQLLAAPAGMTNQAVSGLVSWTPSLAQVGTQFVLIRITDGQGGYVTQSFPIGVGTVPGPNQVPPNVSPVFVSHTVLTAVSGGLCVYAANAVDPDYSGSLTYQLVEGPPGMVVNASSGVVQWIADAPGSYQVVLQVTDNQGGTAQQAFGVNVEPDTQGPRLTLSANPTRVSPGQVTQLSVSALDDVGVASVALTIDGGAWPLDANLQTSWLSQQPGPHWGQRRR